MCCGKNIIYSFTLRSGSFLPSQSFYPGFIHFIYRTGLNPPYQFIDARCHLRSFIS